jgi:septum formation protein
LHSAAVVYLDNQPIWRVIETATLHVRPLSEAFIADYVAHDPEARWCAGGYRIEGLGAQLFERVEGSWFAIMGLPLLPLLAWLRVRGEMPS